MSTLFDIILFLWIPTQITLYQDSIKQPLDMELNEVVIVPEYQFANDKEKAEYEKLRNDIIRVYPLVQLISDEYNRVNLEMELYNNKQKREYVKWYEGYAKEHYMPMLYGLTISQGRLLLLLIDRELGESSYRLIKEYRNGFRAMFWQGTAFMLGANMKKRYNPEENPMIEHIMLSLNLNKIAS